MSYKREIYLTLEMNTGRFGFRSRDQKKHQKHSYAQCGEDLLIKFVFDQLGIVTPTYWDIGAYDPYKFSNTALLYENGSRGINAEPNPASFIRFQNLRKQDINLNAGVSKVTGQEKYYVMDVPALNTFSMSSAMEYVSEGHTLLSEVMLPMLAVSEISQRHFNGMWPDFLSLDVEGMDLEILQSLQYDCDQLHVICVETISYSRDRSGVKDKGLIEFLQNMGYFVYADTYINSIFVRKTSWGKK